VEGRALHVLRPGEVTALRSRASWTASLLPWWPTPSGRGANSAACDGGPRHPGADHADVVDTRLSRAPPARTVAPDPSNSDYSVG